MNIVRFIGEHNWGDDRDEKYAESMQLERTERKACTMHRYSTIVAFEIDYNSSIPHNLFQKFESLLKWWGTLWTCWVSQDLIELYSNKIVSVFIAVPWWDIGHKFDRWLRTRVNVDQNWKQGQHLHPTEIKMLRWSLGFMKLEGNTNEDIREETPQYRNIRGSFSFSYVTTCCGVNSWR